MTSTLLLGILASLALISVSLGQVFCPSAGNDNWDVLSCGTEAQWPVHAKAKIAWPSTCSCSYLANTGFQFRSVKWNITGTCYSAVGQEIPTNSYTNYNVISTGFWCTQGATISAMPDYWNPSTGAACVALTRSVTLPDAVYYAKFATTGAKHVSCYGGSDGVLTSAATYAGTQSWFISASSGQQYGPATSGTLGGLTAGLYYVKASVTYGTNWFTTAGTCYATSTTTAEVRQPPTPLAISASVVPASCSTCWNANITATVTGGWARNGGVYTVSISDPLGRNSYCDSGGSFPCANPVTYINYPQGAYNITVTDCFGTSLVSSYCYSPPQTCTATTSFTVAWSATTTPAVTTTTAAPTTSAPTTTQASTTTSAPTTTSVSTTLSPTTSTQTATSTATTTVEPTTTTDTTTTQTETSTSVSPSVTSDTSGTTTLSPTESSSASGVPTSSNTATVSLSPTSTLSSSPTCPTFQAQPHGQHPTAVLRVVLAGCVVEEDRRALLRLLEQMSQLCEFSLFEWQIEMQGSCLKRQTDGSTVLEIGVQGTDQLSALAAADSAVSTQTSYSIVSHAVVSNKKKKNSRLVIIIVVVAVVAVVVLAAVAVGVFLWRRKKRSAQTASSYELFVSK